jgi:hypothetical protein
MRVQGFYRAREETAAPNIKGLWAHFLCGAIVVLTAGVLGGEWGYAVAAVLLWAVIWEVGGRYFTAWLYRSRRKAWKISVLGMLAFAVGAGYASGILLLAEHRGVGGRQSSWEASETTIGVYKGRMASRIPVIAHGGSVRPREGS